MKDLVKEVMKNLFVSAKKRRRRQPQQYDRPQLEGLEARMLMAGDVSAYISNDRLYINGDTDDNHIAVVQQADGSVRISKTEPYDSRYPTGQLYRDGFWYRYEYFNDHYTLVNGRHSDTIRGTFSDVYISLGSGDDSVEIRDLSVGDDLVVHMGWGGDNVDISGVTTADDLIVYPGGTGSSLASVVDTVNITDTHVGIFTRTGNDLNIIGTPASESVTLSNVIVEDDLTVRLTHASTYLDTYIGENDTARLVNVQVRGDSGGAVAQIRSDYTFTNNLDVAGRGDFTDAHQLYLFMSKFDNELRVVGTPGDDDIGIWDTTVGDRGDVDTFAGNDAVDITNTTANYSIDVGAGNDWVRSGDGDDGIIAGDGNDTVHAGGGNDTVYGGFGDDNLSGGPGDDGLFAGQGIDRVDGGSGADRILSWKTENYWLGGVRVSYDPDQIVNFDPTDAQIFFSDSYETFSNNFGGDTEQLHPRELDARRDRKDRLGATCPSPQRARDHARGAARWGLARFHPPRR